MANPHLSGKSIAGLTLAGGSSLFSEYDNNAHGEGVALLSA